MKRDELPINEPCQANWGRMRRDEGKRHCDLCDREVVDLSAMTEREARALFAHAEGVDRCVRYLADAAGQVVFARDRLVPGASLLRRRLAAAAVLPFGLAACQPTLAFLGRTKAQRPLPTTEVAVDPHSQGPDGGHLLGKREGTP